MFCCKLFSLFDIFSFKDNMSWVDIIDAATQCCLVIFEGQSAQCFIFCCCHFYSFWLLYLLISLFVVLIGEESILLLNDVLISTSLRHAFYILFGNFFTQKKYWRTYWLTRFLNHNSSNLELMQDLTVAVEANEVSFEIDQEKRARLGRISSILQGNIWE